MKISELLLQCGVKKNDTLLVCCSLTGEECDLGALLEDLNSFALEGNLVMPAGHHESCALPNGIFDVVNTPSGEGELSEMFRLLPGVVRSLHPAGSLAALGRGAAWLMADHEKCASEYSSSSPWWKLFQSGVKCVFINCGLECAGLIAAVEEWAGTATLSKRFLRRRIALGNGRNKRVPIKVQTRNHRKNYPRLESTLRDAGILVRSPWDHCDILVMDGSAAAERILCQLHRKSAGNRAGSWLRNLKKL
jgi:aminoglycoside 3-N-acetyltransferase